jgi:hypothetical protein
MAASEQDNPGNRDDAMPASSTLRAAFLAVGAGNLALWCASLIPPYQSWGNPNEDGFSYIPLFYATLTTLPVGIYLLIGAVAGQGKPVRRARKALYIGIGLLVLVVGFWIFQYIANGPDA